jgi:hypothetical protein
MQWTPKFKIPMQKKMTMKFIGQPRGGNGDTIPEKMNEIPEKMNEIHWSAQGVPKHDGGFKPTRRYGQKPKECNVRARAAVSALFTEFY